MKVSETKTESICKIKERVMENFLNLVQKQSNFGKILSTIVYFN